jgi:hypothetical protein
VTELMTCAHCEAAFEFTPRPGGQKFCTPRCRGAAWRVANPDKRESESERARAWRSANPERKREHDRAWRSANSAMKRDCDRAYREANPDKLAASTSKRRARKRNAAVPLTPEEKTRMDAIFAEAQRNGWHVDHIKSLAKGGLHHPDNLVAIPPVMNLSKGAQYWPDLHALQ